MMLMFLNSVSYGITSEDLLSESEIQIQNRIKEKSYPWGKDEEPLEIQNPLPQPTRKFSKKEEEILGFEPD